MKNKMIYYDIYSEFNNVNKFRELKSIVHHGNNRLYHTNRVAKLSFKISKKLGLDYVSCTRGAIMHDFFTKEDISKDKYMKFLKNHPLIALENSNKYFNVNEIEEDIILSHMYPFSKKKPSYPESKVVCICDKIVSLGEFFKYQIKFSVSTLLIFCFKSI